MRTGGIVRIVVPDLDVIGRGYVAHLDSLLSRDSSHEFAYGYALLELFDQTAGDVSGGRLVRVRAMVIDSELDYVSARYGAAVAASTERKPQAQHSRPNLRQCISGRLARESLGAAAAEAAAVSVRTVPLAPTELLAYTALGRSGRDALRCRLFRASGEIYRWVYDRYILGCLRSRLASRVLHAVTLR